MLNDVALSRAAGMARAAATPGAPWRMVCVLSLVAFLGLGLAAYAAGSLPGDLRLRAELLTDDHSALHTLARWGNLAGTWRVLFPLFVAVFLLLRVARERWWLWA